MMMMTVRLLVRRVHLEYAPPLLICWVSNYFSFFADDEDEDDDDE